MLPGLFVAALFAIVIFRQPEEAAPSDPQWAFSGAAMGTTFSVKVVAPPGSGRQVPAEIVQSVEAAIDEVNRSMSTYLEDSEISAFNRHGVEPFAASPALLEVVREAQRVAALSGGAFDITVGPLVDAWGFGPSGAVGPPGIDLLAELVNRTGFRKLAIDSETGTLSKAQPNLHIDLSAIAKGYAVDRVAAALEERGQSRFMVEVGGEVVARGRNPRDGAWRIGIERPADEGRTVQAVVALDDAALATSGDYRNFVIRNGVRLSHTIDPRSGRPVDHALASVSVVDASCMTADALATALEVLGPVEGPAWADRHSVAALFLVRENDSTYREIRSREWSERFENIPGQERVDQ